MKNSPSIIKSPDFMPAADILDRAEANRPAWGQSPLGFLSRQYGFAPVNPPLESLPSSHRAWDEAAAMLPELIATQRVRKTLDELPLLAADEATLADNYLWRAALLLGYLAHAYVHSSDADAPPAVILAPWTAVCQRLGRAQPGLSMIDYNVYNWTLQEQNGSRLAENMNLLVSWFGNQAERYFMVSTTEIQARSGTLVDAVTNLQAAILKAKTDDVKTALLQILGFLRNITYKSLLKIDPNPYSNTYVDPLVWSKAFASYTGPINEHERGLGGSGTPVIQLLDALFERNQYDTEISHETRQLSKWLPPYQADFIQSIRATSLSTFVTNADDQELNGLCNSVFDAYAGKRGFLSVHRLKVYGFMELGFKIGRTETNSGFAGETEARAWEQLDDLLEATRRERYVGRTTRSLLANRKLVVPAAESQDTSISRVVLDVSGEGLIYETGDRLGIFPQNSAALIQQTIQALNATGDEPIQLTSTWRDILEPILHQRVETLPLKTFLAYAKLRPLLRPVAKVLQHLSGSKQLYEILEARQEDQLELWDAFEILAQENYDVKRFCKAAPWDDESLARIIPPEFFRVYSISSADLNSTLCNTGTQKSKHSAQTVDLTIGRLKFESNPLANRDKNQRRGTASNYLVEGSDTPTSEKHPSPETPQMAVQVIHPSRFQLPEAVECPIVMFAGGTGISPFRGFIQQRAATEGSGPNWLFLGTRTVADIPYADELEAWTRQGNLELRIAFSRQAVRLKHTTQSFAFVPGDTGYVDALLDEADAAEVIWSYLLPKERGGLGGVFYICGQAYFAHTVINRLKKLIAHYFPKIEPQNDDPQAAATHFFREMMAQGRFQLDIFTTFAPSSAPSVLEFNHYDATEIIRHNNEGRGYWTVIQGNVYDMTEFMYLHPGGERLLIATAGMDGTRSYEKAEHHLNSEVHAQLDLYKIGTVRRLNFDDGWGIAITPPRSSENESKSAQDDMALTFLTLHDFYRHWIRFVYKVVEIENSLNNNYSMRHHQVTEHDGPEAFSKFKVQLLLESHIMFYKRNWQEILGDQLNLLWNLTLGFCNPDLSIMQLPHAIAAARTSPLAKPAELWMEALQTQLAELAPMPEDDPQDWTRLIQHLTHLEHCDRQFMTDVKAVLRKGLQAFEAHEAAVAKKGGAQLISTLQEFPQIIEQYYVRLLNA